MAKLKVTLIKSPISHTQRTRATMYALGLHRIGQTVVIDDTPELRGMTRAIRFLLQTEQVEGAESTAKPAVTKPAARKKEASKS
ncbi:MAG: 50S ribosomal protein L30 [Chloroflexota bacterium]|nr:50S ribosomal protein L30 [Chloroflexota bacterium]